jgi:hypothetical protein
MIWKLTWQQRGLFLWKWLEEYFMATYCPPCCQINQSVSRWFINNFLVIEDLGLMKFDLNGILINNNNNTNQALFPELWGCLWILNRLIKVGHMYYFPSFYPIQSLKG